MEKRKLIQVRDQDGEEVGLFTAPADMSDEKIHNRITDAFEHLGPDFAEESLELMDITRVFVEQEVEVRI